MTQAQDLAAQGNFGTPQDYYDATGKTYGPVNWQDPNFNGAQLVDDQMRPWAGQGLPYVIVDTQHATAQHPAGSLIAFNSPERQSVYRDMPQENFLKTVAPALLPALIASGVGIAGLGGVGEASTVAGGGIGGGGGGVVSNGLLDYSMTGTLGGGVGTATAGAAADAAAAGGGAVGASTAAPYSLASGVGGALGGAETLGAGGAFSLGSGLVNGIANSGVGTGATAGATTAAAGSALSRILDGTATADDLLRVGGSLGAGAVDLYGVTQRNKALEDIAGKVDAYGAPSRARYEASYAPGFDLATADPGFAGAIDYASKANINALSPKFGNAALSPNAQFANMSDLFSKYTFPALQAFRTGNASAGGLTTLAGGATAAATNAANSSADEYSVLGKTAGNIFNPTPDLQTLLKQVQSGYGSIFTPVRA